MGRLKNNTWNYSYKDIISSNARWSVRLDHHVPGPVSSAGESQTNTYSDMGGLIVGHGYFYRREGQRNKQAGRIYKQSSREPGLSAVRTHVFGCTSLIIAILITLALSIPAADASPGVGPVMLCKRNVVIL